MNTSQAAELRELLRQRAEVRNFEVDFDLSTLIDLKIHDGGNFFTGIAITPGYRSAIDGMIDARKTDISAGIAALGVTEDD